MVRIATHRDIRMMAIDLRRQPIWNVGRPFYLIMSLLMAAVFVGGFSTTVPDDFTAHPGLLLHVHGAVFTLWVFLLVAQPAFIARGAVTLHRRIGMAGAVLAGGYLHNHLVAALGRRPLWRLPAKGYPHMAGVFLAAAITFWCN